MGKISKEALLTGAKKATKYISAVALATSIALAIPTTASAYVAPQNIIGEEQTYEDRTDIKMQEARDINTYFTGYDYYGNRYVTLDQITEAIELSDMLNAYNNYEVNDYSNTRRSEVVGLDVDSMYIDYLADGRNGYRNFCARNIGNKPAVDAFLNCACGTVSASIKSDLEDAVYQALANEGLQLSRYPKIRMYKGKMYAVARVNGFVEFVELHLDNAEELFTTCQELDNRYYLCLNNISGTSNEYPNAFAYNGIDSETRESAWLSLGDDELKNTLRNGVDFAHQVDNNLTASVNSDRFFVWSAEDIEAMRYFGFTEEEINNAVKRDATITYTNKLAR